MLSTVGADGVDDIVQVRTLRTWDAIQARLHDLGLGLVVDPEVDPRGPLAQPLEAADREAANRFCVLPMEGWDAEADGRPSDLVRRRWRRFGASGAGLVWAEATAVSPDGRANPRQLVVDATTVDDLAALRAELVAAHEQAGGRAGGPVVGLQLTHSGRWSRPDGEPRPRVAYRHPLLDDRVGAGAADVLSDDDLDALVAAFVHAAALAHRAGFDFVDVKHCHGYLAHELLSAVDRPGRYGGDLDGRTRFLRAVVEGVRADVPALGLAVRLSAFDLMPHVTGADGRGAPARPASDDTYPYAFGGDGSGLAVDLREAHELIRRCAAWGVSLVSVTAGSPYYTPHIQRPAYFPPSDGYQPPRDPLFEVARLAAVTAELAAAHPGVAVVASGLSYLQQWLAHAGQALVRSGGAAFVGYGRMALSYPDLAADVLAGRPLDTRRICRTLSDCTTAPRNGLVSGCYPYDPFYKGLPERQLLVAAKQSVRAPRRRRS
ncbi:MAG TPA: NADH:flavin oxidoreductase [Acidimicrobiales bacterium]|nr:NADH:flavin oxidoreductase [Acidimicrobiales bacterium]